MSGTGGSNYFIRTSLDPAFYAKVKQQLLDLQKLGQTVSPGLSSNASKQAQATKQSTNAAKAAADQQKQIQKQMDQAWQESYQIQAQSSKAFYKQEQQLAQENVAIRKQAAAEIAQFNADEEKLSAQKQLEVDKQLGRQQVEQAKVVARARAEAMTQLSAVNSELTALGSVGGQVQPTVARTASQGRGYGISTQQLQLLNREGNAVQRTLSGLALQTGITGNAERVFANHVAEGSFNLAELQQAAVHSGARLLAFSAGTSVLLGVFAALDKVTKSAIETDQAMIDLSRVVGPTFNHGQAVNEFTALMQNLNVSTGEAHQALFGVGKTVHDQSKAFEDARAVLTAYKIDQLDINTGAKQFAQIVSAFKGQGVSYSDVIDKIDSQYKTLGITIPDAMSAVARSGPTVAAAGGTLDNLLARLSVATRLSGFQASAVANAQNRVAQTLLSPNGQKKIEQALNGTGIKILDKNDQVKNIDDILATISKRFNTFSKSQQQVIVASLGGGQGKGNVTSIIREILSNYDQISKQASISANSQGRAQNDLQKVLKETKEGIHSIGVDLEALGAQLSNTGLKEFLGAFIVGIDGAIKGTTDLVRVFNEIPFHSLALLPAIFLGVGKVLGGSNGALAGLRNLSGFGTQTPADVGANQAAAGASANLQVRLAQLQQRQATLTTQLAESSTAVQAKATAVSREAQAEALTAEAITAKSEALSVEAALEATAIDQITSMSTAFINVAAGAKSATESMDLLSESMARASVGPQNAAVGGLLVNKGAAAESSAGRFGFSGSRFLGLGIAAQLGGSLAAQQFGSNSTAGQAANFAGAGGLAGSFFGPEGLAAGAALGALVGVIKANHDQYQKNTEVFAQGTKLYQSLYDSLHRVSDAADKTAHSIERIGSPLSPTGTTSGSGSSAIDARIALASPLRVSQAALAQGGAGAGPFAAVAGAASQNGQGLLDQNDANHNAILQTLLHGPADQQLAVYQQFSQEILAATNSTGKKQKQDLEALKGDRKNIGLVANGGAKGFANAIDEFYKGNVGPLLNLVNELADKEAQLSQKLQRAAAQASAKNLKKAGKGSIAALNALIDEATSGSRDFSQQIQDILELQKAGIDSPSKANRGIATTLHAAKVNLKQNPSAASAKLFNDAQDAAIQNVQDQVSTLQGQAKNGQIKPSQALNQTISLVAGITRSPDVTAQGKAQALAVLGTTLNDSIDDITKKQLAAAKLVKNAGTRKKDIAAAQNAARTIRGLFAGEATSSSQLINALQNLGASKRVISELGLVSLSKEANARRRIILLDRTEARLRLRAAVTELGLAESAAAADGFLNQATAVELATGKARIALLNKSIRADNALLKGLGKVQIPADVLNVIKNAGSGASSGGAGLGGGGAGAKVGPTAAEIAAARFSYLRALVEDDPVKAAEVDVKAAQDLLGRASNAADRFSAQAQLIQAQHSLRDAKIQSAESDIQFELDMGQITQDHAIALYQGLLRTKHLTKSLKQQLLEQIHQLQTGGSNDATFGVPTDITLPNFFQVKAAAGGSRQVNVTNKNVINIKVANEADLRRVRSVVDNAVTSRELQRNRSNGFG